MKIPNNLPQFNDEEVLIIVAGRQDAIFYKAGNGTLFRLDAFKIPTPHYSDHEGEFKKRGRGITLSSGGIRELRDEDIIRDFLREFKQRIKKICESSKIYIFAPNQTKNRITCVLPTKWQKKVWKVAEGNYYYCHPLYIIKRISQIEVRSPVLLIDPEAQKILKKSEQARTVMRASLKNKS